MLLSSSLTRHTRAPVTSKRTSRSTMTELIFTKVESPRTMSQRELFRQRGRSLLLVKAKLGNLCFGTKVSAITVSAISPELSYVETRRAEELPGACYYNQDDKAVRPARYDNIHMGTDIKVTKKQIKLTPGPG